MNPLPFNGVLFEFRSSSNNAQSKEKPLNNQINNHPLVIN